MFGYIYKTTNLVNGKIYVGKHRGEFTESYLGSGRILLNAVRKYGKENFTVILLDECSDIADQNEKEIYWISYYRNLGYTMYNIASGGDGGDLVTCLPKDDYVRFCKRMSDLNIAGICGNKGKHFSESHRYKISKSLKGKKKTVEHIEKHRLALLGKQAWNKGLTADSDARVARYARKPGTFNHSEETKQHLSAVLSGRVIPKETRQRMSESRRGKHPKVSDALLQHARTVGLGRIWVNNSIVSKMIHKEELEEYLQNGYTKGRIGWKAKK